MFAGEESTRDQIETEDLLYKDVGVCANPSSRSKIARGGRSLSGGKKQVKKGSPKLIP